MARKKGKTPPTKSSIEEIAVQRLVEELELLRGLAHLLPEAVVIQEPNGEILFSNEAAHALCGGVVPPTFDELSRSLLQGRLRHELQEILARACHTQGVFLEECRSGDVHLTVSSRTIGADFRGLRLWSFVDRSQELRKRGARHPEAIDLFATGLAHDFNELLSGISGAVDVLETIAGDDTRAKRCVGLTRRCVDDGMALTRTMLRATPRPIDDPVGAALDDVVRRVTEVQRVLQEGRVAFEICIPPDLPPVGMPTDSLVGVIQSLVRNSVGAIAAVGTVKISAEVLAPKNAVALRFEGNGVGLDEATLRTVLESVPARVNPDLSNGVDFGGGVSGLLNVYRAVETAGGTVSMKSEVGKGTTVEVTLPISREG